jgi:peptidoglycan/LPS O-acetylase OafA/YrhL
LIAGAVDRPRPAERRRQGRRLDPGLSTVLDHARWLAALVVLLFHVRLHTIGDYGSDVPGGDGLLVRAFFFVTGLGHEAVIVFFVLSGALVAGKFVGRPPFTLDEHADYLIDRLTRIWVVAVPALIFSVIVAQLAQATLGAFYSPLQQPCAPGALDLIANLFFLHKAFFPILCSNGPYWSIHNEVWYYLLLPATLLIFTAPMLWLRGTMLALVIAAVGALLVFDPWDSKNTLAYLPVWLAGALVATGWRWRLPPALGVAFLVLALALSKGTDGGPGPIKDYLIALALLALLFAVKGGRLSAWWLRPGLVRSGQRLAGFSYSLYLTHAPVIYLLRTVLVREFAVALPTRAVIAQALAIMLFEGLVAIAVAWLFYLAFERHTDALRAAIRVWLGRQPRLARATPNA